MTTFLQRCNEPYLMRNKSVLISFDVFPNVYSPIYYVFKIIHILGSECTRHISYYPIVDLAEPCELYTKYVGP